MMQHIYFEGTIKNGYIKVPEKYAGLSDQRVMVEILDEEISRTVKAERVKNIKEFLQSCSGILQHSQIPTGISVKQIREMRLSEKYGI